MSDKQNDSLPAQSAPKVCVPDYIRTNRRTPCVIALVVVVVWLLVLGFGLGRFNSTSGPSTKSLKRPVPAVRGMTLVRLIPD